MGNVLVIAQIQDGEVKKATHCTVTLAAQIAKFLGCQYHLMALGDDLSSAKTALCQLGAAKVLLAQAPALDQGVAERLSPIIEQVIRAGGYSVVLSPSSSSAKDTLPRLAAKLGAGMASEVIGAAFDNGKITFTRPMYAGNVNGFCQILTDVAIATVRATEFAPTALTSSTSQVESVQVPPPPSVLGGIKFLGFEKSFSARPDLSEAKIVVSGGRGLKAKENFAILENLADVLGAAVGATRAAVDAGFIDNDFQVGQTGKIVAPDLYFAVGLSGALQHVAGMKSAKVIVAINKDEEAPIFQIADYGMVADLFKVIPELAAELKKSVR